MKITIINCFEALNENGKRMRCPFCVERDKYEEYSCNLTGKPIELADNEDELEAKEVCFVSTIEIKMPVAKREFYYL